MNMRWLRTVSNRASKGLDGALRQELVCGSTAIAPVPSLVNPPLADHVVPLASPHIGTISTQCEPERASHALCWEAKLFLR